MTVTLAREVRGAAGASYVPGTCLAPTIQLRAAHKVCQFFGSREDAKDAKKQRGARVAETVRKAVKSASLRVLRAFA